MKKIMIFLLLFILFSCDNDKTERITFLSLQPRVITDKNNNSEIFVEKYLEYCPHIGNQIKIAKSEGHYELDNKSTPKFGLDKFYSYKYDAKIKTALKKLFSTEYKNSYFRKLSDEKSDDRNLNFIVIEKGKVTRMILYEHRKLPLDLKEIDTMISDIFNSKALIPSKRNISENIIYSLQDSLFNRNPPPRLLKSSVKFDAPVIEEIVK